MLDQLAMLTPAQAIMAGVLWAFVIGVLVEAWRVP